MTLKAWTRGVACPSADARSKVTRRDWCAATATPVRSSVVSPVASGTVATCTPVVASSRRAVPVPLPPPLGEKSVIVAVNERQALTTRPAEGPIEVDDPLPDGEKLTGACVSSILPSNGAPAGLESRACQRTPRTVSRKLSASVGLAMATGKYSDQNSFPVEEYGCRKLTQSATELPLEVRTSWRKSRTAVDESPS